MKASPAAVLVAIAVVASSAYAQKPIVYPTKGKSAQQKQRDDKACMTWARQEAGIDLVAASAPPRSSPPPSAAATGSEGPPEGPSAVP